MKIVSNHQWKWFSLFTSPDFLFVERICSSFQMMSLGKLSENSSKFSKKRLAKSQISSLLGKKSICVRGKTAGSGTRLIFGQGMFWDGQSEFSFCDPKCCHTFRLLGFIGSGMGPKPRIIDQPSFLTSHSVISSYSLLAILRKKLRILFVYTGRFPRKI